mmetsp:Transcript_30154/g.64646  ORF Transcript_30154/g.64646 Transcript_30154/m.64646 type:complete len:171 (-) Transcript_30154:1134-1646(-)
MEKKIGKLAAKELLEQIKTDNNTLKAIHIIGISVGAFSADATVNELKKNFQVTSNQDIGRNTGSNVPFVQLTLLDPFQQRGVFGVGHGKSKFGVSADFTEQYLNTDDPVPSTGEPIKNAVCYDVTNLRPDNIFGHDWPLVYYARSDQCGELATENSIRQNKNTRGTVIKL